MKMAIGANLQWLLKRCAWKAFLLTTHLSVNEREEFWLVSWICATFGGKRLRQKELTN
jgi:hypothetical protein